MSSKKKIIVVETDDHGLFATAVNVSSEYRVNGDYSGVLQTEESGMISLRGDVVLSVTVQGTPSPDTIDEVIESYKNGFLGQLNGGDIHA